MSTFHPKGHILDANCEALWRMDATGTTIPDESAYAHTLTLVGASTVAAGVIGNARNTGPGIVGLSNANYFAAPAVAASDSRMLGDATAEAWVKAPTSGGMVAVSFLPGNGTVGGEPLVDLQVSTDGKVYSNYNAQGLASTLAIVPAGVFTHIAVRRRIVSSAAYLDYFVNGEKKETKGPLTPLVVLHTANRRWFVGTNGNQTANAGGLVDDIRVSFIARTDAEILESYRRGAPETPASPFARALKQLLPRGLLWFLDQGGKLDRLLVATGDELARIVGRAAELIEESDPRTATETLSDWETALGLPDEQVTVIPATDAARRLAITQKLIRLGGQHAAFYIALAAACGYTATVNDSFAGEIFRVGSSQVGDGLGSLGYAFQWELVVSPPAGTALTHAQLEAIINRAKPAHTTVVFTYL